MSIYVKYMSFYVKICAKVLFPDDKTDFFYPKFLSRFSEKAALRHPKKSDMTPGVRFFLFISRLILDEFALKKSPLKNIGQNQIALSAGSR